MSNCTTDTWQQGLVAARRVYVGVRLLASPLWCSATLIGRKITSHPYPVQSKIYNPGCPRSSWRDGETPHVYIYSSWQQRLWTTLRSKPGTLSRTLGSSLCSRRPDDSHTTSATPTYHPFLSPTSDAPA